VELQYFYSAPVGELSICVCMCLSVREHISGTSISLEPLDRSSRNFFSVLLWRRCDVMYFRFYGWRHVWRLWAIWRCMASGGGVWCLWMPCLLLFSAYTYSSSL